MNRTELIGEVSKQTGLTTKQAESGLKAFENVVTSALRGNDTVRITGFGTSRPVTVPHGVAATRRPGHPCGSRLPRASALLPARD